SAAVRLAANGISDVTHFIPCHLGLAKTPREFSIGSVRFEQTELALARLEPALSAYIEQELDDGDGGRKVRATSLVNDTQKYYASFDWIAEICITGCDRSTSKKRAERIVQSALDCLHLLIGAGYSNHMRVGGPGFSTDRRGKIEVKPNGRVEISTSVDWLSHPVGDGWWEGLTENGRDEFIQLMGVALDVGHGLPRPAPMAQRFLDGVAWFGEAARDPFHASRLIKFVTAIERILTTKNETNLSETLAARGAAMASMFESGRLVSLRQNFKEVYNLRSLLVHGARSALEPGLGRGVRDAERLTRLVLFGALQFYGETGLQAKDVSLRKHDSWFEDLLKWAERGLE
ncbi:MAG TPA: hypothetical protein VK961_09315, partial [Chthoniobacter sp.]|nr:hypothetical protein [Chthoniobacter sp.]